MDEPSPSLDDLIEAIRLELDANGDPASPRYKAAVENLEVLSRIKRDNDSSRARPKVDPNQLIAAGSSLGSILAIIFAERTLVLGTKALGFVTKLRFPI